MSGKAPARRKQGGHGVVKPRPAGTLKGAITALADALGGHVRTAEIAECSKGHVQRWTDPDGETAGTSPPVHKVRLMEAAAGDPIVTRFLAAEAGFALIPLNGAGASTIAVLSALAAGGAADLWRATADALGDGVIDAREAGDIVRAADASLQAIGAVRARAAIARGRR